MLFTDTLADVNGVARFVRNVATEAASRGLPFLAVTSTPFEVPPLPTMRNLAPLASMPMPAYPHLRLALPPVGAMLKAARAFAPDVVHMSTPGPVGLTGVLASRLLRVPLVGVYHTDFPAYVERLLCDEHLGELTGLVMGLVYRRFSRVLSRSDEYRRRLLGMGLPHHRLDTLAAGIRTQDFGARFADRERMARLCGGTASTVRIVYVGRVSVEKNLAMLARVWRRADALLAARGVDAQLVIVGDGPFLPGLKHLLLGTRAACLGFRHDEELAMCHASGDVFAFPSTTDTLGQAVMESQASGVAAVVTDEGGPCRVVRHGETGWVLPAADEGAWVERLTALACDEAERRRMGAAAAAAMAGHSMEASFDHFWHVHAMAARKGPGDPNGPLQGVHASTILGEDVAEGRGDP
jgi:glycosyltransferase involved in cell wall biosynthesis